MPTDRVEDFVEFYRGVRDNQPYKNNDARILSLHFEELVYDYDEATLKIRNFLKLPENPNPKSIFDPSMSIANTQVFKRYPQYSKDIEYIEKEIPEYLFDYDKYGDVEIKGEMFVGSSPKKRG